MFMKQIRSEELVEKDLVVGHGLEITGYCGGERTKLVGVIEFISHSRKTNVHRR